MARAEGKSGLRLAVSLFLLAFASQLHAERPRVFALTHATVVTSPGQSVQDGTIVLRDGLVESVGKGVAIPPDAVEIDLTGSFVYAGFVDAGGKAVGGATEPEAGSRSTRRQAPPVESTPAGAGHPLAAVHPEKMVRDGLQAIDNDDRKREAETYRSLGFGAFLAAPGTGVFQGQSALVLLQEDRPVADLLLLDSAAQHVGFDRGGFGDAYPTSLMGAVAAIRQTFLDAQRYATWTERYAAHPAGMQRPERSAAYEALQPVLAKKQLVIFEAKDPDDVLIADRIAKEAGIDAVVLGSGFEQEIASQVAATKRVLIYPVALPDKPKVDDPDEAIDVTTRDLKRYAEKASGASVLHDAGIELALTTRGLKNTADFWKLVRKSVDAGLPQDVALAALTTVPAKILGVERQLGTIEAGKIANLVVADKAIFAKDAKVKRVFVEGREYKLDEKKKPKGDPSAVVDPRGTWSVVLDMPSGSVTRSWTISGKPGALAGTAEIRSGTVTFEKVELEGNALTVVYPAGDRPRSEATVIVSSDSFEGTIEVGSSTIAVHGTRTSGPEGGSE
jgi:imidazolonepropionase-like amidohydrolase